MTDICDRVAAALLAQSDEQEARNENADFWFPGIETLVSGFLAALAAGGLTVTTTERAAIGEAVERLPVGKALCVGGRIMPPEFWYRVEDEDGTVIGGPGVAWSDPAEAIDAALRGTER